MSLGSSRVNSELCRVLQPTPGGSCCPFTRCCALTELLCNSHSAFPSVQNNNNKNSTLSQPHAHLTPTPLGSTQFDPSELFLLLLISHSPLLPSPLLPFSPSCFFAPCLPMQSILAICIGRLLLSHLRSSSHPSSNFFTVSFRQPRRTKPLDHRLSFKLLIHFNASPPGSLHISTRYHTWRAAFSSLFTAPSLVTNHPGLFSSPRYFKSAFS